MPSLSHPTSTQENRRAWAPTAWRAASPPDLTRSSISGVFDGDQSVY